MRRSRRSGPKKVSFPVYDWRCDRRFCCTQRKAALTSFCAICIHLFLAPTPSLAMSIISRAELGGACRGRVCNRPDSPAAPAAYSGRVQALFREQAHSQHVSFRNNIIHKVGASAIVTMNREILERTSVIKYGTRRLAKRKEALKQIKTWQMAGEWNLEFFNLLKSNPIISLHSDFPLCKLDYNHLLNLII